MKLFAAIAIATLAIANGAPSYNSPANGGDLATGASSQSFRTAPREEPIAIVRSAYNAPGTPGFERAFDYSFEAENGIKQEATGELRTIDDAEVMVMRGSYEFIGADAQTYVVDWYADETGFHPSAAHLPKSVPIPDPEHAELIEAQIRFAAEENARERQAAASAPVAAIRQAAASAPVAAIRQASSSNSYTAAIPVSVAPVRQVSSSNSYTAAIPEPNTRFVSQPIPAAATSVRLVPQAVTSSNSYVVVEETPEVQAQYTAAPVGQRQGRRGRGFFRRVNA